MSKPLIVDSKREDIYQSIFYVEENKIPLFSISCKFKFNIKNSSFNITHAKLIDIINKKEYPLIGVSSINLTPTSKDYSGVIDINILPKSSSNDFSIPQAKESSFIKCSTTSNPSRKHLIDTHIPEAIISTIESGHIPISNRNTLLHFIEKSKEYDSSKNVAFSTEKNKNIIDQLTTTVIIGYGNHICRFYII